MGSFIVKREMKAPLFILITIITFSCAPDTNLKEENERLKAEVTRLSNESRSDEKVKELEKMAMEQRRLAEVATNQANQNLAEAERQRAISEQHRIESDKQAAMAQKAMQQADENLAEAMRQKVRADKLAEQLKNCQ